MHTSGLGANHVRLNQLYCAEARKLLYCMWEFGGGQIARQSGQVRKEAAVTSSGLGRRRLL